MKFSINTKLTELRKIDPRRKKALKKLGLITIEDLIFYYPKRYDDFTTITPIARLTSDTEATIRGLIISIENSRTPRRNMRITEALIKDDTGTIKATWFNQHYLKNFLSPGTYATFHGKIEPGYPNGVQIVSPVYEKYKEESIHTDRIVPVYGESAYLTSKWIRYILKPILKNIDKIPDWLPNEIIKSRNLLDINTAIHNVHFPENMELLEKARRRLSFDELFLIQLNSLYKKYKWKEHRGYAIKFDEELIKNFVQTLPFQLTDAQKLSAWDILKDIENKKPMNRLLEGDVGSGKTIVATLAILQTVKNRFQATLMAPTEILAKQHFESLSKLFTDYDLNIAILTRNHFIISDKNKRVESKKNDIIKAIKSGEIDLVIGTHAIIQEKVKFNKLALAIIDEQHRFGVKQRSQLTKADTKPKTAPHLLSMTATPIPRTLALSLYGDLDLSIIDEMPLGRKKILTKLVAPYDRHKAYDFISKKIAEGRQVFVVCPLIEESDKLGVKSATEEYSKLSKEIFPNLNIGLLHGKLKKEEKESVMQSFLDKKIDILVSTSVIEVGIDVPNATIMMIEGSERFGLSQLHQFRGRVGRSDHQSYCFLFTDSQSEKTYNRLNALLEFSSGFKLAEKDLELRGPGEVFGIAQSGIPDLRMASLMDVKLIKEAKEEAEKLLNNSLNIDNYPVLKEKLDAFNQTLHFE